SQPPDRLPLDQGRKDSRRQGWTPVAVPEARHRCLARQPAAAGRSSGGGRYGDAGPQRASTGAGGRRRGEHPRSPVENARPRRVRRRHCARRHVGAGSDAAVQLRPADRGPEDARHGRPDADPPGQAHQGGPARHHHHRLLHRIERHRGGESRRGRVPHQAVQGSAGARRRVEGARRTGGVIQLSNLSKSFGDRTLIDHVTWQISDGDRVGLCGPNGAGKTTVLKMLAGIDEPDEGGIVKPAGLTIGYLPQDGLTHAGRTVFEEASSAFQPLLDMKAEMHDIEHRLGDASIPQDEHDAMLARYSELQDRFRLAEGYSMDLRIATVLRGLGFDPDDAQRPAETFSGGWQMRIALAKLLLGRPNLLLLDEPTNHLDLEARNWLEEYLGAYPFAVILVSHDRYFLDAVVTRITDIHLRRLTDYVGNYSRYVAQRDAMLERLRQAKKEQDEETARIKMFIDRFRYQ